MKKFLVPSAALLAAGLFLAPDDAAARPYGGFHGGGMRVGGFGSPRIGAFHGGIRPGGFGFRPGGFGVRPGFGYRPGGFGFYRAGFRPWGYYRRPYWGYGLGTVATGAVIGAGLAAAAAPYYSDYGYADVGNGGVCYQVPAWAWTGWGYQRVLATRCY